MFKFMRLMLFPQMAEGEPGGEGGSGEGGEGGGGSGDGFLGAGGEGSGQGQDDPAGGAGGAGDAGDKGGGSGEKDLSWLSGFSDETRKEAILHDFGSAEDALKGYVSLFKKMGAGPDHLLRLPADDAPDSDYAEIFKRLGRPNEPEDYEVPKGVEIGDEGFLKVFQQGAHAAGVTQKQFAAMVKSLESAENGWSERQTTANLAANETAKSEARTALQSHFGKDFPENDALIGRTVNGLSEGLRDDLENSGLLYNVELLKAFADLGNARREDGSRGGGAMGVSDAHAEWKRLSLDSEFQRALASTEHPEHKNSLKRKNELYEIMYPNELSGPGYE